MQSGNSRWQVYADAAAIRQAAFDMIMQEAARAIADHGKFSIVLAGGTTPREVYQQLREAEADWSKWHVYFGDERCLPPDHADRNSKMAADAWLSHVAIPQQQVHDIPAELGPERGAAAYAATLADIDEFDLVLLGLGEDGHTASLFPDNIWEMDGALAIPVHDAPKPPPERISIAASRLSRARKVVFLVTGAGKQEAVRHWRAGQLIPAAAITAPEGVEVWLDQAAAG